jgi:hypothetical protein
MNQHKMDETMLMEILNEIDTMTPKEYWVLFYEAQKLPDYLTDWELTQMSPTKGTAQGQVRN